MSASVENAEPIQAAGRRGAAVWLLATAMVGYPFLGTLVAFTSLSSLAASVPVRAGVLVLALVVLWRTHTSTWRRLSNAAMVLFFAFYLFRVLWDLYFADIPVAGSFLFSFLFFSVPPALALMHADHFDESRFLKIMFPACMFTCVLALIAAYTNLSAGRSWTADNEGRLFLETVNPITFGEIGVTTILAALSWIQVRRQPGDLGLAAGALILGALTILLSASRGPFVSLLVCLAALTVRNRRFLWILPLLVGGSIFLLSGGAENSPILLISRLLSTVEEHSEVRMLVQTEAVAQFLDNPILGSAIIERESGDYPHNLVIEAGMAMGVMGLFLYVPMLAGMAWRAVSRLRAEPVFVPLIAIQYLVAAQFSGSISASVSIWALMALLGALPRSSPSS